MPTSHTVLMVLNWKVDGTPIAVPSDPGSGWYKLNTDTQALTYSMAPYFIGLIGSATPNGWKTLPTRKWTMMHKPEPGKLPLI